MSERARDWETDIVAFRFLWRGSCVLEGSPLAPFRGRPCVVPLGRSCPEHHLALMNQRSWTQRLFEPDIGILLPFATSSACHHGWAGGVSCTQWAAAPLTALPPSPSVGVASNMPTEQTGCRTHRPWTDSAEGKHERTDFGVFFVCAWRG